MRSTFFTATILVASAIVSTSASGQVLVETGILTPKSKDLGSIWDRGMKDPTATKPNPSAKTKPGARPAAAAAKPKAPPETFSSETEDPMSILDINVDVLTRFVPALAAETASRASGPKLTPLQHDEAGAKAGGFTPRQYFVLKARVRPFCEAVAAGQAPADNLVLSYMPSERIAIGPRCSTLLPALKLVPPVPLAGGSSN
jgi:hypothetical protein